MNDEQEQIRIVAAAALVGLLVGRAITSGTTTMPEGEAALLAARAYDMAEAWNTEGKARTAPKGAK